MYRLLVGTSEGKRPLGRRRHRWLDNNKMDPAEIGWGCVDGIGLVQDRGKWKTAECRLLRRNEMWLL